MLYDNTTPLLPHQQLSITKFASDLAPLSPIELERIAVKLATMLIDEEARELCCVLYRAQTRVKKVANIHGAVASSNPWNTAGKAIMIAAAVLPLIGYLAKAKSSNLMKSDLRASYNVIKQRYPDMATDPMFDEEFSLIASFSPAVAAQPIPTANIIRQLHRLGPESVTPQLLEQLIGIEESKFKITEKTPGGPALLKDLGGAMSGVLK